MKKIVLVLSLAVILVLGMSSLAYASGYLTPGAGLHANYSATSNKCKMCHAVHLATGSYKLLRSGATSGNEACSFCHIGSGAFTTKLAYFNPDNDPATGLQPVYFTTTDALMKHTGGVALSTTPDTSKTLSGTLICYTCHTVHGAKTITGYTTDILRGDPAGDSPTTLAADETEFCADCHDKNLNRTGTNTASHIMDAAPDNTRAWVASYNCKNCHAETTDFPHAGGARKELVSPYNTIAGPHALLGGASFSYASDGVTSTTLDRVCLGCHVSGESGVGKTF